MHALEDPRTYDPEALNRPQREALVQFWEAWIEELKTVRVLDPACGSGAFLIEAFDQLHAEYQQAAERLSEIRQGGFAGLEDESGARSRNDPTQGTDCVGHGTSVASAAAGKTYGSAKKATVHSLKIVNICEPESYVDYAISAIDYVIKNHRKPAVANMSYTFPKYDPLDQAAKSLIAAGVSFVLSAGNTDQDACNFSPKAVLNTVVVAASLNNDARATYSNWGACVNLFAPGENVRTASYESDTGEILRNGTSYSAPQVAGVAALLLQQDPSLSPSSVKKALQEGATLNTITGDLKGTPNRLLYSKVTPPTSSSDPCQPEPGQLVCQ